MMSITTRETAAQHRAPAAWAGRTRVIRNARGGQAGGSAAARHLGSSDIKAISAGAGRTSLRAPVEWADRNSWRWQLMVGLGRTLLFIGIFFTVAAFVEVLG